jgi:hypothetical protein
MGLADKLAPSSSPGFGIAVRSTTGRRVKLKTCRFQLAEAVVRDTSDFEVLLSGRTTLLHVASTCPSSLGGEPAHVWAVP